MFYTQGNYIDSCYVMYVQGKGVCKARKIDANLFCHQKKKKNLHLYTVFKQSNDLFYVMDGQFSGKLVYTPFYCTPIIITYII